MGFATPGCESSKPEWWQRNRPDCHTGTIKSKEDIPL